jgi:hypothetical protein
MSETESIYRIFLEPAEVFNSFITQPRYLLATLILLLVTTGYNVIVIQRFGFEEIVRTQIESSSRTVELKDEDKQKIAETRASGFVKALGYAAPLMRTIVSMIAGAGLYLLGVMLMGSAIGYLQSVSLWVYSTLAPALLLYLVNAVLLLVTAPEDVDLVRAIKHELAYSNPGALLGSESNPFLLTLLTSLDLFEFYGLFLAVLGLKIVARLQTSSALMIVGGIWLIALLVRLTWAFAFGVPISS